MRTAIAVRFPSILAALAGIAVSLAGCGAPPPSLTFTPVPASGSGAPLASSSPSSPVASVAATSGSASPTTSSSPAAAFPDARHAVRAFSGTYQAELIVVAASGSVSQDLGATHSYTWHVVPDCGATSCVDHATSTSKATFTLSYSRGEFDGTGGGISHCLSRSGQVTGPDFRTTLKIALQPATSATPITSLVGAEALTASGGCDGSKASGTEVIQYMLTRTGN
jgi:hypothetical protein